MVALGYYAVSLVVAWFASILLQAKHEEYGVFWFMLVYSNSMFMGFPVMSMIFGPEAIFFCGDLQHSVHHSCILLRHLASDHPRLRRRNTGFPAPKLLLNVAFISTFVGLALFLTSTTIPDPLNGSLALLDSVTTPLSLVVTGGEDASPPAGSLPHLL